jgi:nuclear pore complex protein Nup98-Nup96
MGGGFGGAGVGTGAGHTKFALSKDTETGGTQVSLHSITAMQPYANKSFEELRLEDYQAGRKGGTGIGVGTGAATGLAAGFATNTGATAPGTASPFAARPATGTFPFTPATQCSASRYGFGLVPT